MKKLEEIRARAEKATLGPWDAAEGSEYDGVDTIFGTLTADDHGGEVFKPADAEFIAHSRTDVPKLVAALEAVEAEIRDLEEMQAESASFFETANVSAGSVAKVLRQAIQEALQ